MNDIHSLKEQISAIDEQLKATILNAIQEVAKTQSVNKINRYTMTVKLSELSKKKDKKADDLYCFINQSSTIAT